MIAQLLEKALPYAQFCAVIGTLILLGYVVERLLAPLRAPARRDFGNLMRQEQLRIRITAMRPLLNYMARMRANGIIGKPSTPDSASTEQAMRDTHLWL